MSDRGPDLNGPGCLERLTRHYWPDEAEELWGPVGPCLDTHPVFFGPSMTEVSTWIRYLDRLGIPQH